MATYSVTQVSQLSNISVRTLHYYDTIGLLKPANRGENGYRFYSDHDLVKLQQILFYKELNFSLKEIEDILSDPRYNLLEALQFQRKELTRNLARTQQLIDTIDTTMDHLKNERKMETAEMYTGFDKTDGENIRKEALEKWGEAEVLHSEENIRNMGAEKWKRVQLEGQEIAAELGKLIGINPNDERVQQLARRQFEWLSHFYEVSRERFIALADLYVQDERFRAFYDDHKKGTAELLCTAMKIYAKRRFD